MAPPRIKIELRQVDQDLFVNLSEVLGPHYFSSFQPEGFLSTVPSLDEKQLAALASHVLPGIEHNPVIEFHLRPGEPEFARLLGVSVRTLQEWEQGRRAPTGAARTLLQIADKNPKALLGVA